MLRLHTLGRFELTRPAPSGAETIPIQPKRLALLAYLCINGIRGPQRRDTLLALFWPESSQDEARRALRQALYYLRNALGDGVLVSRADESLVVAPEILWCDAVALEATAEEGRAAEALELYGGDFLAGVYLPEVSAELEQWIDSTRARLRTRAAAAAWTASDQAAVAGHTLRATVAARRAVELQPDDEAGVRRLIEILHRSGDRLSALGAYEELVTRFRREFGAEPSAETQALGASLRAPAPAVAYELRAPLEAQTPVPLVEAAQERVEQPATSSAPPPSPPRPARSRRWMTSLAAAAALLVVLGLAIRASGGAMDAPQGGRPLVSDHDRILVADLANHTRDSLLAGAITEALRVDLAQSRLVGVMSSQQVRGALARMERTDAPELTDSLAREVALREGVNVYVTGAVGSVGRGYVVSAALVSAQEGEVLAAVKETAADSSQLLDALDRVGAALRRRLGEKMDVARGAMPLERVTTRSLDALRKYSEAVRAAERQGDDRRALSLLQEAVARDSGFAMAWRKLAVVAGNFGEFGTSQLAAQRAFQYRNRLPDRERYLTTALYYTHGDRPQEALRAYASLLELYPTDVRALFNSGFIYMQLRDFRRAEEYHRRALAVDSTIPAINWGLAADLINQGKLDAAAAQIRTTLRRFPGQERALWLEVDHAIARGDLAAAERRTRELLADPGNGDLRRDRGLRTLMTLALMRGRVREAERHLHELELVLRRQGSASERVVLAATRGFVETWYRGSGSRGARLMEESLEGLQLDTVPIADRHNAWRAYVYALAGQPERAFALTKEARSEPPEGIGREAELFRAEGVAWLAQGRVSDGLALLRRSVDGHFCPVCSHPDLARAYDRAGMPDSAIAIYERYVATPWTERWSSDGEFLGHALLRLGELHEARHDTTKAVAAYRRFTELWREADPELQPMVARARARLVALAH